MSGRSTMGRVRKSLPLVVLLGVVACSGDGTESVGVVDDVATGTTTSTTSTTAPPSTNTAPASSTTTGESAPTTTPPSTAVAGSSDGQLGDVAPTSAEQAARRITAVERAVRDPETPPDALAALGWEQQSIYRTLAGRPRWYADVLASAPDDVALLVFANVGAGSSLGKLVEPPDDLPDDWRIVAPPPVAELLGYYREAEQESGIPWQYLAAINLVETRMGRIVGDSSAGAQGPMQFIPSSWEAFGAGGDVRDPRDSILAAGRYLAAAGGPQDMGAALFAYNHSDAYVDAVERYAQVMTADEQAYRGYYHWQVLYRTVDGTHLLVHGYPEEPAVPLA